MMSTNGEGLVGFVTGLVEKLGGPGAGLAVALENLFPPIPSLIDLAHVTGYSRRVLAILKYLG